jgi:hypothetical protein
MLQALALTELLQPGAELYAHAPWLGDLPLLDNSLNSFGHVLPDLGFRIVTLSDLLLELLQRRVAVRLAGANGERSRPFLAHLQTLLNRRTVPGTVEILVDVELPQTGLLGADYFLEGRFEWMSSGPVPGLGPIVLHTEDEAVANTRAYWSAFWREHVADARTLS